MTKEELIVKIKKLQAMSESSNPNEAAMALSRIQKLMETYSLEASDLDEGSIERYVSTLLQDLKICPWLVKSAPFLKKPSVCSQFFIKRVPHP